MQKYQLKLMKVIIQNLMIRKEFFTKDELIYYFKSTPIIDCKNYKFLITQTNNKGKYELVFFQWFSNKNKS